MEKSQAALRRGGVGWGGTVVSKGYSYNIASGIISGSTVNKRDRSVLLDFFHKPGL